MSGEAVDVWAVWWRRSTVWTTLMGVVVQVADDKGASFVSGVMARCLISTVLVLVGCAVVQMNPMGTNPQVSPRPLDTFPSAPARGP